MFTDVLTEFVRFANEAASEPAPTHCIAGFIQAAGPAERSLQAYLTRLSAGDLRKLALLYFAGRDRSVGGALTYVASESVDVLVDVLLGKGRTRLASCLNAGMDLVTDRQLAAVEQAAC